MSPGRSSDDPFENRVGVLAIGSALGQAPQLTEVNVEREIGLAADFRGHLQHLDAPARKAADLGVPFNPPDDVAVGVGGGHRGLDVDAVRAVQGRIKMSLKAAHEVGR